MGQMCRWRIKFWEKKMRLFSEAAVQQEQTNGEGKKANCKTFPESENSEQLKERKKTLRLLKWKSLCIQVSH